MSDIDSLCHMLEKNQGNHRIANAIASAIKSLVLSALCTYENNITDRYRAITLRLKKLLDTHLSMEKSPTAYASKLNIS